MNFKLWHRIAATIVFIISTIILAMTVAPTISFWDCSEFITASVTMSVPHPPGNPLFQILGKMFTFLPTASDIALRHNLISTISSSLTALLTFLVIMRLFRMWYGDPDRPIPAIIMFICAAIGAFIISFSDTFWFNGVESEVYAIGIFFIAIVVWIGLEWYAKIGMFKDERALILCAYITGISIGIHLLSLLTLFFLFFLIYLRDKEWRDINNVKSMGLFTLASIFGFVLVYPFVVKYIPQFLAGGAVEIAIAIIVVLALLFIVAALKSYPNVRLVALSVLLVIIGYSTYSIILIRANAHTALNENDPHNLAELYRYLNREQYGEYPLLKGPDYDSRTQSINFQEPKLFPRRWSPEHISAYKNYSSDLEYFISFQLYHEYLRYFLYNFVGRAGDMQGAPVAFIKNTGEWSDSEGYPNKYYAIPLILGLFGIIFHFKKDWKTGTSFMALFLVMGLGLVVYFNATEPQVRERDYFYIGSFYVFALWVGIGAYSIYDYLREKFKKENFEKVGLLIAGVCFVIAPLNMLKENYHVHDRSLNYVAFDYAYNLLQSCDQDAILFTGGDNDTFPVWYLQYVAGVRRDIRVVNLSLVNTPWYSLQLKNEMPYGAKKVDFSYDDDGLRGFERGGIAWEKQTVRIPIDSTAYDIPALKDVPSAQLISKPKAIEFTVEPTFTDMNGTKGLRVQDMMIIDIATKNFNKRPIYFALTTAPGDRVGLDDFLMVEGLAYRLTPIKFTRRQDRYYSAMNIEITKRHLLNTVTKPDSNRSYGFMYRELNNPKINLDEQSTRMVMSYRILYMALSQVIVQDKNDKKAAGEVLAKMEQLMPTAVHRMDVSLKTDLNWMYYLIDQKEKFNKTSDDLEKYYLNELSKDISGRSSARDPYSVLLNIYQLKRQFKKGVELMKRYKQTFPQDQGIDPQIAQWERMAAGDTGTAALK